MKVVIKVSMNDQKSRKKAMRTVVGHSGVESTALQGQEKNQIEVVGDGIDAVELTTLIRKNVGYAELVSVSPIVDKKDGDQNKGGDKKDSGKEKGTSSTQPPVFWTSRPYTCSTGVPYQLYEVRYPSNDPICTIM